MRQFDIWAPFAEQMSLRVDGEKLAMQGPDDHGLWTLTHPSAEHGTEYGFQIDGKDETNPDPRSQWQPDGVHKLSRIYDHTRFIWNDAQFRAQQLSSGVVYELHIGTFSEDGTLDAAIPKLAGLVELGITHVELMPVAAFDGERGWGYDGVALFAVHEPYGGPDALKRFVDAAHQRGLAVLLDVVYNHFGPSGNYTGKFGPYITDLHHTPWGGAVNLESAYSDQVRRFFCDNALMWLRDFHIDGLRLDAVHAFVDRSAIHFLEQLSSEVAELQSALQKPLVLIAESDLNDPRVVTPREAGGYGIDAQWSDDFHHALFSILCPAESGGYYSDFRSVGQLAKALKQAFIYDGIYSNYRKRTQGKSIGDLSLDRFIGFIQNHDQIGNRATGDRIHQLRGIDAAKVAAAIYLLSPFVPMLFQGEEWAASTPFQYFANHQDRELARLVSEGRKREFAAFGWSPELVPDPESIETFRSSRLLWDERNQGEHAVMLEWYRALIQLRRSKPALNHGGSGSIETLYDEDKKFLQFRRADVSVVCNFGDEAVSLPVDSAAIVILASHPEIKLAAGTISLPPISVAILNAAA